MPLNHQVFLEKNGCPTKMVLSIGKSLTVIKTTACRPVVGML